MRPTLALAALFIPTLVGAQTLLPGSAAPSISVKKWIKGTPVKSFAKNKTYVVEFWATWCGPCIESIPHISELAKKNKDVTFMGISIWEDNPNKQVENFVKKMGAKMSYNVAYGGDQGGMAKSWMTASGSSGIPTAFVVKNQKIMWIGHPMELDEVLPKVKSGKLDVNAERIRKKKELAQEALERETSEKIDSAVKLFDSGKREEAKKLVDKLESSLSAESPQRENLAMLRLKFLAIEDFSAFEEQAKKALDPYTDQGGSKVFGAAYMLSQNPAQIDTAVKVAELGLPYLPKSEFFSSYMLVEIFDLAKKYQQSLSIVDRLISQFGSGPFKDRPEILEELKSKRADLLKKLKS